ncbi:MAG: M14 family zinc carboxypeptidase, partial [Acidobacteria bacterium]|nr:M14 family zinc carboxypeptidase [Acidobacteriota bacterium]
MSVPSVRVRLVLLLCVLAIVPAWLVAQQARPAPAPAAPPDLVNARFERDPRQPIDEEYTKKIKEYTTETFFLSPFVDYLPASKTVPTPSAVLGNIAGAPGKLPYTKEVHEYMRLLAKSSPRVRVMSIGASEEGREMIAVAVASEAVLARMDANRANLEKLGDPRTIKMNDAEALRLAGQTTPVYYITGAIHSTESGSPTALMELAYRLAVDDSAYIRNIRDNLITLITPVVETDGRDRMVDLYEYGKKYPDRTVPNLLYWGKYVAHDNNRDAMGMTLKLTENVLNTFIDQKAQVLHDLHESVAYLYDNTIGDGPYNAWVDPILTNEWQMVGWHNVNEMTRLGMPGVFAFGTFDTWSPGYLMFIAATHNGISRLYETFGNGGNADTRERTLTPAQTSRTWYRQNPPLPKVMWSLRNNNNYQQTGLLVSLGYFANNRRQFLWNFYEKSKRSILKATTEGPAAYVLPANDPRLGTQAELLRVLQKQRVEVSRAVGPFSVEVPVRPSTGSEQAGNGRGGRGGAGGDDAAAPARRTEKRDFPAGSYIVRMDQPYSRIADALFDHQFWSPNDQQDNPYDDTGWTFPESFNVQAIRVMDTQVLEIPVEKVTGAVTAPGGVQRAGSGGGAAAPAAASATAATAFGINHNADNAIFTLRYRLPAADIAVAEEPFEGGGVKFNRGSFIVRNVPEADLHREAAALGLKVYPLAAAPAVKAHPARAARVALMHTWSSTQTEGWWRIALDSVGIPYDYISTQEVSREANLRAKYDVILFGPGGGSTQSILNGMPMWRDPMPWKQSPDTPNIGTYAQTDDMRPGLGLQGLVNLQTFVKQGGVYIGAVGSANFAIDNGMTHGVSANSAGTGSRVVGSLLRTRLVDDTSPIVYGIQDQLAVYSDSGASFSVSATGGGRGGGGGGGRGGGAGPRATGRGLPDETDAVQGRPALDPRFEATPTPRPNPWAYALPTDEQMRSPLSIIPPQYRPRVALRFADQNQLLVSGLLQGGGDIAQRPVVVDVPVGQGHVVLFANNPLYRG